MRNATAAAASQHVGYPIFIAAATVWLANRARWSWLTFLYPAAVFTIVARDGEPLHARRDHRRSLHRVRLRDGAARARLAVVAPARAPAGARAVAARGGRLRVRGSRDRHRERAERCRPTASARRTCCSITGTCAVVAAWFWSRGDRAAAPAGSGAARAARRTPAPARDASDAGLRGAAPRRQRRRRAQAADEGARAGARGARARGRASPTSRAATSSSAGRPRKAKLAAQLERAIEQRGRPRRDRAAAHARPSSRS